MGEHTTENDAPFWDRLGYDEGGLPAHLPMGVNIAGQGPEDDADAHHYVCWCGDNGCPLTVALDLSWRSAMRFSQRLRTYVTPPDVGNPEQPPA